MTIQNSGDKKDWQKICAAIHESLQAEYSQAKENLGRKERELGRQVADRPDADHTKLISEIKIADAIIEQARKDTRIAQAFASGQLLPPTE